MDRLKKYSKYLIPFFLVLILIIFYKFVDSFNVIKTYINEILNILKPFFVGFLIAYILNLPSKKIQNLLSKSKNKLLCKYSKGISIFSVYILALIVIIIAIRAIVPAIYRNILDMYTNAPVYLRTLSGFVDKWQSKINIRLIDTSGNSMKNAVEKLVSTFDMNELSKYAQGVINLTSGLINAFISIIVSLYMLIDKDSIKSKLNNTLSVFMGKEKTLKTGNYLVKINDIFSKYIYCRLIDAVIIAVVSVILLTLLRVKYALILGIMVGFANLIPYFGSIIGSILAVVITVLTGGVVKAVWVGVSLLVLEQIDGNFIGPKIMGEILEIKPLVVIFAVTLGGGLFGILGLLFSVPVVVVIKMIFQDYLKNKSVKNKMQEG